VNHAKARGQLDAAAAHLQAPSRRPRSWWTRRPRLRRRCRPGRLPSVSRLRIAFGRPRVAGEHGDEARLRPPPPSSGRRPSRRRSAWRGPRPTDIFAGQRMGHVVHGSARRRCPRKKPAGRTRPSRLARPWRVAGWRCVSVAPPASRTKRSRMSPALSTLSSATRPREDGQLRENPFLSPVSAAARDVARARVCRRTMPGTLQRRSPAAGTLLDLRTPADGASSRGIPVPGGARPLSSGNNPDGRCVVMVLCRGPARRPFGMRAGKMPSDAARQAPCGRGVLGWGGRWGGWGRVSSKASK
jgi:hypothetical protein